jgi:hypothetical protein
MSFMDKVRSWWRKDDVAEAQEESKMTAHERDVVDEGYEGRKDDVEAERGTGLGTSIPSEADFERDSERPR